jgi:hypothetical protein
VVDGADPVVGERRRQYPGHGCPVLEDVADARRVAEVVLEHPVGTLGVAHEVDAGDEAAGGVGHRDAGRLPDEAVGRRDQPVGHDAVLDHGPLADVEVVEEAVERGDPLDQTGLDERPLVGWDDPGQEVHREGALGALVVAVDGERDALGPEAVVAQALPPGQLGRGQPGQPGDEGLVVGAHHVGLGEDLIEEPVRVVAGEQPLGHDG